MGVPKSVLLALKTRLFGCKVAKVLNVLRAGLRITIVVPIETRDLETFHRSFLRPKILIEILSYQIKKNQISIDLDQSEKKGIAQG